ncbi:hypothetical protein YTPLAS18_38030 [Nitrospira sp.]|nr:hypothetical protein YTPLAS18_38030 [Nitrospira sp.]
MTSSTVASVAAHPSERLSVLRAAMRVDVRCHTHSSTQSVTAQRDTSGRAEPAAGAHSRVFIATPSGLLLEFFWRRVPP